MDSSMKVPGTGAGIGVRVGLIVSVTSGNCVVGSSGSVGATSTIGLDMFGVTAPGAACVKASCKTIGVNMPRYGLDASERLPVRVSLFGKALKVGRSENSNSSPPDAPTLREVIAEVTMLQPTAVDNIRTNSITHHLDNLKQLRLLTRLTLRRGPRPAHSPY